MIEILTSEEIDLVVAISRGGLIPGLTISEHFKDIPLDVIVASSYSKDNKKRELKLGKPSYLCFPEIKKDSRLLIVDDLVDSGETMEAVVNLYRNKGFKNIKTAVLFYKECSKFKPDFFVEKESKDTWIHFPYEVPRKKVGRTLEVK